MNGFLRDFADDDHERRDWSRRPSKGTLFITEATYQWSATDARGAVVIACHRGV
jgi:hypothetical protein